MTFVYTWHRFGAEDSEAFETLQEAVKYALRDINGDDDIPF